MPAQSGGPFAAFTDHAFADGLDEDGLGTASRYLAVDAATTNDYRMKAAGSATSGSTRHPLLLGGSSREGWALAEMPTDDVPTEPFDSVIHGAEYERL